MLSKYKTIGGVVLENKEYVTKQQFSQILDLVECLNNKIDTLKDEVDVLKSTKNITKNHGDSLAEFLKEDKKKRNIFGLW